MEKIKRSNNVCSAGRARCAAAGSVNLKAYLERQDTERSDMLQEVERFRSDLLTSIGENPSPEARGLLLIAASSYTALLRVFNKFLRSSRIRSLPAVLDAIPRLQGHLMRSLAALEARGTAHGERPLLQTVLAEYRDRAQEGSGV